MKRGIVAQLIGAAALACGAGGNVGIGAAAKSPPDGYTIVLATPGIAIIGLRLD